MKPNPDQLAQINRKYGMFCHYGMNTYLDLEWSDGTAETQTFNPPPNLAQKIDAWPALAKAAGMRYLMLTTKHHDGFCLFPSDHTDYHACHRSIAHPIDVVGAVSDACRRQGIELAMYYSLWDRHEPTYKNPDPHLYVEFMKRQLHELLTRYGPVCELWLDGQWDRPRENWFFPELYDFIKKLQPHCQVGINHTLNKMPALHRELDEVSFWPSDFRLFDPYLPTDNDPKIFRDPAGNHVYLPFESTITMSPVGNWFAHEADPLAVHPDALEEVLYKATRNDNILVINISPRKSGELFPATTRNLTALAQRLNLTPHFFPQLPKPRMFTYNATATASGFVASPSVGGEPRNAVDGDPLTCWTCNQLTGFLEVTLQASATFNNIILIENARAPITSYTIESLAPKAALILAGAHLSNPAIPTPPFANRAYASIRLPYPVTSRCLRLTIHASNPTDPKTFPAIHHFGLHHDPL